LISFADTELEDTALEVGSVVLGLLEEEGVFNDLGIGIADGFFNFLPLVLLMLLTSEVGSSACI
jgi:hypothetical protein